MTQYLTNIILFIYAGGIGFILLLIINNGERELKRRIRQLESEIEHLTGKELQ